MLEPGDRVATPFGMRRSPAKAEGQAPARRDRDDSGRPAGSLAWALRVSAAAGLAAVCSVSYLARLSAPDRSGLQATAGTVLVQAAIGGRSIPADPETTGAIAPVATARAIRLDPCVLPSRDGLQP